MPFLTHGGVSLRYDRAGSGPAVLFIHGWTFNRTVWERQVVATRDRHTAVTVDVRGHGESSHPRTGYSIASMAADLEQLVRALNVAKVAIVGWSMGGMIAMELARRLGERASALVVVCSTAGGLADALDASKDEAAGMRAAIDADFRAFVRDFAPRLFKAGAASPFLSWAVSQMQKTPAHVAGTAFDALVAADLRPALKEIVAPTAVFHGRHDAITPLASGEEIAKGIRGAKLTIFEESGHAPFLEEPERFNEALVAFLASPGAAARSTPAPSAAAAPSRAARPTAARAGKTKTTRRR